jgi:Holliday junction resolvase RusA-like endonuclease
MNMFTPNPIKRWKVQIPKIPYCSFWVSGKPRATPRIQAFRRGKFVGTTTPDTADDWKALVAIESKPLLPQTPIPAAIICELTLVFPRPQRLCRKRDFKGPILMTKKPDPDNCYKAVSDILTNIGMWRDDCLICDAHITKWYHAIGEGPGAHIEIDSVLLEEYNRVNRALALMREEPDNG